MLIDIRSERQKTKSKKQRQNIWDNWFEMIWKKEEKKIREKLM